MVASCPVFGEVGAPLLYHNAALQRVLFAGDSSLPEHELREQARGLLTLMMDNIPEELHRPYHSDMYVTEGLEGAQRVMEYAFTEMNRDHVISLIAPANVASVKVAERLGETVEGETELMGHYVLIYGISRDEWRKKREAKESA
jgi:hypothetical protein